MCVLERFLVNPVGATEPKQSSNLFFISLKFVLTLLSKLANVY